MTTPPVLSVLIVSWNVREMTLRCLERLHESVATPHEVILVDNASDDGTTDAVSAAFPSVQVIANASNLGFPGANNQGLAQARGRYVLFLNPDTEVGPGAVDACVEALDADSGVGIAGCRLLYPDGTTQYECARNAYRLRHILFEALWLHMFFPRSRIFAHQLMGHWDHRGTRDVEAVSGAFLMTRTTLAREVGGLPDEVFMYHEDLAFCLRVRRTGHRVRYLGDVWTVHHAAQSSRTSSAPLALLEGFVKVGLVREAQGAGHAAIARVIFGIRSILRLLIAAVGRLVPGLGGVRRRYPKVFDARMHGLHLLWSLSPSLARRLVFPSALRG